MTITILSVACLVLAALCLCLWVYAAHAAQDATEAMWETDYYAKELSKAIDHINWLKNKGT